MIETNYELGPVVDELIVIHTVIVESTTGMVRTLAASGTYTEKSYQQQIYAQFFKTLPPTIVQLYQNGWQSLQDVTRRWL